MILNRRQMMAGGLGMSAGLAAAAGPRVASARASSPAAAVRSVADYGIRPDTDADQTSRFQTAIDDAAKSGQVLHLPAGAYRVGALQLRSNSQISGVPGLSLLKFSPGNAALTATKANNIHLTGLVLDGSGNAPAGDSNVSALLSANHVSGIAITACKITSSRTNGISLNACSGQISDSEVENVALTGVFCNDSAGLDVSHNHVHNCGNNGIQIWRSSAGEDGTIVAHNRIDGIRAALGGSGQYGNGINVFRANSVQVTGNRITDCDFTAIRGNAASNFQVIGNSCARLGEVAIYAEFGFEGTIIANNLVDKAATGISITNFNEGGRMAVAQGNLIRNLFLRKGERGVGIAVEADAMVTGNLVEGAPGGGIMIGWGKYQRDVNVTANLIREARIGIGVSTTPEAGYAYITNNMISVTSDGGVRAMDHAKPLGPDLAKNSSESFRNIAVFGNVSL
ncbi:MAG: TIGR03808 family TAT-translocated repetitive protein [Hyphomicrobiaceae bacterium]|nr:TIGR03808 family TAT-translocated repetitive protein [Hyphomicrobiaceae bacterium]